MSSGLPVVSGQEAVRLTIPDHRTLKPGLLRALIRDAGLDVDAFVRLVHG